ncbi:ATP-binding protein [Actinosynnema sp. NPDC023587]|uniref:ATP-binding protein n=1 Tax=Actinosynnema sp. NPDC023587 TaxID=3154695 RepID=UPI0033ECE29C
MATGDNTVVLVMREPDSPAADEVVAWLAEQLDGWSDHEVVRVGVVVDELVDNARRYGEPPYVLQLVWDDAWSTLVVIVCDRPTAPPGPWLPRAGLVLVEALTLGWGVESDADHTVVWAHLRFDDW